MDLRSSKSLLALILLALPGCSCLFPLGPGDEGDDGGWNDCLAPPGATCADWRCADGVLATRTPARGSAEVTGPLSGQFVSVAGLVAFTVQPRAAGGVEAAWTWGTGCRLDVTLVDGQSASVTVGGVPLTGRGALTEPQRAALAGLGRSAVLPALVQVPLQLGCQTDVPDAYLAALLFPWQVLLKYDPAPDTRAAGLEALGRAPECRYFTGRVDDVAGGPQGPLRFAPSDLVPNVFGYFPLDGPGASEPTGQPLEGDLAGPCGAVCRGACGADCPSTNCTVTYRTRCESDGGVWHLTIYNCGVHDGCVAHDDCYDDCHRSYGCGTWGAALCRRGCDAVASGTYSTGVAGLWAKGYGPFQRRIDFEYRAPGGPWDCSCVAEGTPITLADGSHRRIEALAPGDRLAALELDGGALTTATVLQVLVHRAGRFDLDQLVVASGQRLEVTGNHPVLTPSGFVQVEALRPGDAVLVLDEALRQTRAERLVAVTRRHSATSTTYNLQTTAGNYVAADILVHNKCLGAGSAVETPAGPRPVESLRPGDLVRGERGGERRWTPVLAAYRKETVLPALPGKRLAPALALTANHVVTAAARPAGELDAPDEALAGPVFDLDTGTGNYLADGVLLEAANSTLRCER